MLYVLHLCGWFASAVCFFWLVCVLWHGSHRPPARFANASPVLHQHLLYIRVCRKQKEKHAACAILENIHVIPNKIHRSGKFDQLRCVFGVNPEFQSLVHMEIWKSKMFFNLEIILVKDDNDNNTAINCGALRLYR